MFQFNEDLFNEAYLENSALLKSLDSFSSIINDIYNIEDNYEDRNVVEGILDDLNEVIRDVDNLDSKMTIVKKILSDGASLDFKDLKKLTLERFSCFDKSISGEYGANQNRPYLLYKMYLENPDSLSDISKEKVDLIKSVFEKYQYAEADDNLIYFSLRAFQNGGCGVAAITNVIIDYYSRCENGSKLFEEKYGFPLYYVYEGNKIYNYEGVFVKTYLDSMEHDTNNTPLNFLLNLFEIDTHDREYIPIIDEISTYKNAAIKATGLHPSGISKLLQLQFSDKEVDIEQKTYGMTFTSVIGVASGWDDTKKLLNEKSEKYDYCIISAHNFEMRSLDSYYIENYNNNEEMFSSPAGHALLVTGLSENGNPIVSSWGYEFELTDSNKTDIMFINIGDTNE